MSDRSGIGQLGDSHHSTRSVGNQIEFLPPNDAAFGLADVADFVGFDEAEEQMFGDDGPRSKWLPAAATVVVMALLGGGIIAAAPWDSSGDAGPTTSTTVAPSTSAVATTDQAPTTTDRILGIDQVGPAGYVLDDPGTFQLAGAWAQGAEFRPSEAYADDWFDLWTSPGATRTTGHWLAVTTSKSRGDYDETLPNGTRIVVGDGIGVLSTDADGVARLLFTATDGTPFEIGGFGFGLGELLTVAAQVGAQPDDTVDYGSLPDGILTGLTPTVSAHVPTGGLNPFLLMAQRQDGVYYVDPVSGGSVELTVSQPTEVDVAVVDFLFQPVIARSAAEQAQLDVLMRDGRRFQLGVMPDRPDTMVATSVGPGDELMLDTIGIQADGSLTVWGTNVSVPTMIRVLSQVRLASDDEWVDAVDRSNRGLLNVGERSTSPPPVVIGLQDPSGPDDQWYRFEMTPDPSYIFFSTGRSGWGGPLSDTPPATNTPTVRRFASASVTFLVGTVSSTSPIRQMRVTLDGLAPVDVPMVSVGEDLDAAGYAFTEMLPDSVEFLDENGNVVAV